MADTVVGLQLTADTSNATSSVKSFKQQLREATEELVAMNEKFGSTSAEAANAAKKVAELQDAMADAKSLSDAFNPDQKFAAFSGALQTVTGGFAALTGAMSLFGVESEEVNQTLLKVQSALALSEGVNSVLDGIQSFKNLGAVVQQSTIFIKANEVANKLASVAMRLFGVSVDTTSISFKVLKTAIAATGIGLLIVALGEVYSAFQNFSNAAQEAADAQKELNEQTLKFAKTGLQAELNYINQQSQLAVAKAKAEGKSQEEIAKIQEGWQQTKLESLRRYQKEVGDLDIEASTTIKNQEIQIQIDRYNNQASQNDRLLQQQKQHNADKLAEEKAQREKEKKIEEERRQAASDAIMAWKDYVDNGISSRQKLAEEKQKQDETDQKDRDAYYQQTRDADIAFTYAQIDNLNKQAEAVKETEERKSQARQASVNVASNLFGSLSQLMGEQTAAGKAFAIAQTTIDTFSSATKAFDSLAGIPIVGPALGAIAAAAAVAAGIANVKKIVAVKTPGGTGGSTPSISTASPLSSISTPTQTYTTLNQESINKMGEASSKAYVVESDVTDNQQRVAMLNRQARIT